MMRRRKQYSNEFKYEAVAMVTQQGRSISEVSDSLDVGQTALRRWVQADNRAGQANNMSQSKAQSAEQQRISELEKQVKTLQKERDLLKKSISFFAREIDL